MMYGSDLLTHGRRLNDLASIFVELVHKAGGNDRDVRRVLGDDLLQYRIGQLVMGKLQLRVFPSEIHVADIIPKEWIIVDDVEPSKFKVANLELISFLKRKEEHITSDELCKRAIVLRGNMGLCDAAQILIHQEEIHEDLAGKCIVFPGTILRNKYGFINMPYLRLYEGDLALHFCWVNSKWNGSCLLARNKRA